jgi:hypothetical protein
LLTIILPIAICVYKLCKKIPVDAKEGGEEWEEASNEKDGDHERDLERQKPKIEQEKDNESGEI